MFKETAQKQLSKIYIMLKKNKRVQRALRHSPEKVKGHSGAINRGPLMLYTKYQGSSRFVQEDFQDSLYYSI